MNANHFTRLTLDYIRQLLPPEEVSDDTYYVYLSELTEALDDERNRIAYGSR